MRKTIDDIKSELSKKPKNPSFRELSREEQSLINGKRHIFLLKSYPKKHDYSSSIPQQLRAFFYPSK